MTRSVGKLKSTPSLGDKGVENINPFMRVKKYYIICTQIIFSCVNEVQHDP